MVARVRLKAVSDEAKAVEGTNWTMFQGDCVSTTEQLPDSSIDYTIFSPPFESLYTFSDDPRDMSNCRNSATFWEHFRFLIKELQRVTKPGRLVTVHCMQLPTSKVHDGYIGLRDFRGEIIRNFCELGFIYHSEVCIRKDPVMAMQRTKALGLLHKQIVKDSAMSRQGVADYMVNMLRVGHLVTVRRPGDNPEPIAGELGTYHGDDKTDEEFKAASGKNRVAGSTRSAGAHQSIEIWQKYAEPVWMDISMGDVLSKTQARDLADERHIAPLQLTAIKRCVQLWSNPDDVVFSPFAGIGSELYVALQLGRKALGVELKPSYFEQAVKNLRSLGKSGRGGTLLS
jgi:DNA modification methylase